MTPYRSRKAYRQELEQALKDPFLRRTLSRFARTFREAHQRAFAGRDYAALTGAIARSRASSVDRLDALYEEFKAKAEAAGARVHLARDAEEACRLITNIAREAGVAKVVKSKSMTTEEVHLNMALEAQGLRVTETDLGEWIIQLRHERPSHMTMPAIHLSRQQIAELFTEVTSREQNPEDIPSLVEVARQVLRPAFFEADMGITGANAAIAETGTLALISNEGNIRLVTTLPRVHVALVGLEKLIPDLDAFFTTLEVLPRNVGGQAMSAYVTYLTGAVACESAPSRQKELHIVFLDNGRRLLSLHPVLSEALRCVRCGACANVCPIYGLVGGHRYGHVYVGAIGLIFTAFFHGRENAQFLVENCLNCQACKQICSSAIDLPRLIKEVDRRLKATDIVGRPKRRESSVSVLLRHRKRFHQLLRAASRLQGPVTRGDRILRHLPMLLQPANDFRTLPALAKRALREEWKRLRPVVPRPAHKIGLFGGCLVDFVYPEQARAFLRLLEPYQVQVEYPMAQSCCGLPVAMMTELEAAEEIARQNVVAFSALGGIRSENRSETRIENRSEDCGEDRGEVRGEVRGEDLSKTPIVTLCASCASHLKSYPELLKGTPLEAQARAFADRVVDASSYLARLQGLSVSASLPGGSLEQPPADGAKRVAYHAPCHLCRGLGVKDAPRALVKAAGHTYVPVGLEEVCCGFGGHYSLDFPEVSSALLAQKLQEVEEAKADWLVTDCPGCVLQLRGGVERRGERLRVGHVAELLSEDAALLRRGR